MVLCESEAPLAADFSLELANSAAAASDPAPGFATPPRLSQVSAIEVVGG